MPEFQLEAPFAPTGDQPTAIEGLLAGLSHGHRHQTLLGATGTGKTFTIANIVQATQRPTLVMAHNKTLAAQLYAEFKRLFPDNAIEYFVSYYDYYQPEAYVPRHDLYIEKSTDINEQIERLRLSATASLFSRRDVLIVASVSCIYGIGDPVNWRKMSVELKVGDEVRRERVLRDLVRIQYHRNDLELRRGAFRARGDTLEIVPGYSETAFRIYLWGDKIEKIVEFQPLTGEVVHIHDHVTIFPAREYITDEEHIREALHDIEIELEEQIKYFKREDKLIEAQRIEQRTRYDIEMLREVGFTTGIENYSRHFDRRPPGSAPFTLIDYLPEDHLLVIDESHMTVPQIRGMYNGDRARKQILVDYGFRLPSALDNRPLQFNEFWERVGQTVYTSATPGPYEGVNAEQVVEQIIRPTGIVDPLVDVRPTSPVAYPEINVRPMLAGLDDLKQEILSRVGKEHPALVSTFTKCEAEEVASELNNAGIKARFVHSDIDMDERAKISLEARDGLCDVLVGIKLRLKGVELPNTSLLVILDSDKPDFWRSKRNLLHLLELAKDRISSKVIMFADRQTSAMNWAIKANRRAIRQDAWERTGIEPSEHGQIDDLLQEIALRVRQGQRVLVTTMTQRMSEELAGYINGLGIKGQYLHAEVDTLERVEILRDLRMGVYDVVVGINLLREGLDLPEVSLVAILDADKSGFLRSEPALIQTIGRAARHIEGKVIMYAEEMTPAMQAAINETDRRRAKQESFNLENGIEPQQIVKDIQDITDRLRAIDGDGDDEAPALDAGLAALPAEELQGMINELEREMNKAAQALEFEKAAALRDQIFDLRGALVEEQGLEGDLMLT
ncbi:MAG: excinuclease ABC subunit UvrB [Chloroflexi bacterium]|nr:excinuclease ABC subunit UvrB [Chloroflexota bacterium]